MKKMKAFVVGVTAATLAISCGALIACGNNGNEEEGNNVYEITFDANGGSYADGTTVKVATDENGRIAQEPTRPVWEDWDFVSYNTEEDGSGTTITYGSTGYVFSANTTVYAQWTEAEGQEPEHTVTLHLGNGTLPGTPVLTYTTDSHGRIELNGAKSLPVPTANIADWTFTGWYDAEENGNAVDERTATFTADADLYAYYARKDGVWDKDGETFIAGLTRNTGETTGVQYWLGEGVKINLNEGKEISLYMNGELVTFNVHADFASGCIEEMNDTSSKITSVTVSEEARFAIYLWDYADTNGEFWSCQFLGTPLSIATTSTIPEGCEPVKIVANNGTATLYLVINGVAVNSENAANYQIHGWQDSLNFIFGAWGNTPNLAGNEDGEIVVDANLDDDLILMFYWNGGQSGNVSNVTVGGTFIVKIVSIGGDKITVKAYDENGPEDTDEEELPQLVVNGYYLSGDFNSWGLGTNYYIDENKGLTLTLTKGQSFQAMICTGTDGSTRWPFSAGGSFYKLADDKEGEYFVVSGNNIKMSVTGEYTITYEVVDADADKVIFTITPADGLEPAEPDTTEYILSYFIKGNKVTGWANKTDNEYKMVLNDGIYTLEIELEAGDEFMFYMMNEHPETHAYSTPAVEKFIQSGQLADGVTCVTKSGYNFTSTVKGTYTFTYNSATDKLTVTVVE